MDQLKDVAGRVVGGVREVAEATLAGERPGLVDAARRCMEQAGMSSREMTADANLIPRAVRDAMQPAVSSFVAITNGQPVRKGFGLSGTAGVGKSFALACMFRQGAVAVARARLDRGCNVTEAAIPWFLWRRWPEVVNRLRVTSTREGGLEQVESILAPLYTTPCLVLDDLGAERVKNYEDDWATSQLDLLVDHRHGAMLPIWWTTNLHREAVATRYGVRFYSRLCGDNPLLEVGRAADQRLRKGAA